MRSKFLTIAVLLFGFYLIFSLSKSTYRLWQKTEMVKEAQKEKEAEERKNQELKEKLEFSQRPEFIEKEARDKLGLARPGETIVILSPLEATQSGEGSAAALPNWKKWLKLFF